MTAQGRILDFGAMGMRWEITRSTSDTSGKFFEAINILEPGFAGPPLHTHPSAEESYEVLSGTLDVCVDGTWQQLKSGQSVTVPPGIPHTLRNPHEAEVRLLNVHKPALEFEPFFRKLQSLVVDGRMALPPRNFQSLVLVSMLFHRAGNSHGPEFSRGVVLGCPAAFDDDDAVMRCLPEFSALTAADALD